MPACISFVIQCHAGAVERRLAQDSTPFALNVTLVGVTSLPKAEQVQGTKEALIKSLLEPKPSQVTVSSAVQSDQLFVIFLVYPSSNADAASLNTTLEGLNTPDNLNIFTENLNAVGLTQVTTVVVNSVTLQPQNQYQRDPLAGASLAGWTKLLSMQPPSLLPLKA